jgi:hypothetical protein
MGELETRVLLHLHPKKSWSKRPGDQVAYISVGNVGFTDGIQILVKKRKL